jgi:hypothetical protein
MGDWNNPVMIPADVVRPNLWGTTIVPTITQVLGNLALAKIQHGWQMEIADRQIAAQQAATKQAQEFESGEGEKNRASAEKIARGTRSTAMMGHMMDYAATVNKPPATLDALITKNLFESGATNEEIISIKNKFRTEKDFRTALQKNVPYLAEKMNITEAEAAQRLTLQKGKSDEAVWLDYYGKGLTSTYGDEEEARRIADTGLETYKKLFSKDSAAGKKVVNTGVVTSGPHKGRKVVRYDDGTTSFAD